MTKGFAVRNLERVGRLFTCFKEVEAFMTFIVDAACFCMPVVSSKFPVTPLCCTQPLVLTQAGFILSFSSISAVRTSISGSMIPYRQSDQP